MVRAGTPGRRGPFDSPNDTWVTRSPMPGERLVRSVDELPIALTVAEAAAVLRISRTTLYELIRVWNATGGADGLRAVRLGRSLRVPRIAILEFLGIAGPRPEVEGVERGTGGDRGAA